MKWIAFKSVLAVLATVIINISGAGAADAPTTAPAAANNVTKGKQATALVEIKLNTGQTAYGSAFCVNAGGLFVTNSHVIQQAAAEGIKLVLNPNEDNQKVFAGKVLRRDDDKDLALVQVKADGDLPLLELGCVDNLMETAEVLSFGYPFGKLLGDKGGYPDVSVSTSKVTSLRKAQGRLTRIQLDGSLNPGNSGGPVLGKDGKVIGVVESGVFGASVCMAIPVSVVAEFLARPELTFTPPAITDANASAPARFEVKVASPLHSASEYKLELELVSRGEVRRMDMPLVGDKNVVSVVPAPPRPIAKEVHISASFARGTLDGYARDVDFKSGGKQYKLSQIACVDGIPAKVTLTDQTSLSSVPAELVSTEILLGENRVVVDLTKAHRVVISLPTTDNSVEYKITASYKGQVADTLSGTLVLGDSTGSPSWAGNPGAGGALGLTATKIRDVVEKKLPDNIDGAVLAANGRFIVMHMPKTRRLAVLDTSSGEIVKYLPVDGDDVAFAGGADKLVVLLTEKNVLQRYNLATFEKELTVPVASGSIKSMVLGCGSVGPAVCLGGKGLSLLDLKTLTLVQPAMEPNQNLGGFFMGNEEGVIMHASGDGSVVGVSRANGGGFTCVTIQGKKVHLAYQSTSDGAVIPSADGKTIFTAGGGMWTQDLKPISVRNQMNRNGGVVTVPACQGNYYLQIHLQGNNMSQRVRQPNSPALPAGTIEVNMLGESRPLLSMQLPDGLELGNNLWGPGKMAIGDRVLFIPGADMIAFIPETADKIFLKQFNVVDALKKSDIDYLFVSSMAPTKARKGQAYEYKLTVLSKRGGVKYTIDSGPEGMKVSSDGRITWPVPASFPDSEVSVIAKVADSSGQETYHTFTIQIEQD